MIHDALGYYEVLGVDPGASIDQIRAAHRSESKKWHPDTNHSPGAADRMRLINQAKQVLLDPGSRASYDRMDPPPPVLTQSQYLVDLSGRKSSGRVTVTSSRPIGVFTSVRDRGDGWRVDITQGDELTVVLEFVRDGRATNAIAGAVETFEADVDGATLRVDVKAKSAAGAGTKAASRHRKSAGNSYVAIQFAPYAAVLILALSAAVRSRSWSLELQMEYGDTDFRDVCMTMLRTHLFLALSAALSFFVINRTRASSWATPRMIILLWAFHALLSSNPRFEVVLTCFALYFIHVLSPSHHRVR